MAAVWSHTLTNPAVEKSLNKIVATRLIAGHIRQTVREQRISRIQINGISGVMTRFVRNRTGRSITNISRIIATGHIIFSSPNAIRNT